MKGEGTQAPGTNDAGEEEKVTLQGSVKTSEMSQ